MACLWGLHCFFRNLHGLFEGPLWLVCGVFMACLMDLHSLFIGSLWVVCGVFMACLWGPYGLFVWTLWLVCGCLWLGVTHVHIDPAG